MRLSVDFELQGEWARIRRLVREADAPASANVVTTSTSGGPVTTGGIQVANGSSTQHPIPNHRLNTTSGGIPGKGPFIHSMLAHHNDRRILVECSMSFQEPNR